MTFYKTAAWRNRMKARFCFFKSDEKDDQILLAIENQHPKEQIVYVRFCGNDQHGIFYAPTYIGTIPANATLKLTRSMLNRDEYFKEEVTSFGLYAIHSYSEKTTDSLYLDASNDKFGQEYLISEDEIKRVSQNTYKFNSACLK